MLLLSCRAGDNCFRQVEIKVTWQVASKINVEPCHFILPNVKAFYSFLLVNPFTLKSSSRSIVCYFHTFGNNLEIKQKFAKYFKESCCLSSD